MRGRQRRYKRQHKQLPKPKIIRCLNKMKPVFDNETCNEFEQRYDGAPKICKSCKFSE